MSNKVTITTNPVSMITSDSATGGGLISDDGRDAITERGVCWSIYPSPTINNSKVSSGSGKGSFSASMRGLQPNTTYYVRAYSISDQGEVYGNEVNFKTPIRIPTLITTNVTNITGSSASTGGQIVSDGGGAITARGICWSSSNSLPTINDNRLSISSGNTTFAANLTNLMANTPYWVRAYAVNSAGIGYGPVVTFQTGAPTVAELSAVSITNVGRNTATATASVNSNGGALLNTYGVCVSTSSSMSSRFCYWVNGNVSGAFSVNMTNLQPGTLYYVRAYATNAAGEGASTTLSTFTTQAPSPPIVTTLGSSSITLSSASMSGNVTDDGGLPVLERGFFISSVSTPSSSSTKVVVSSTGTGSFSANITGLQPGTTYYYRAFARNAAYLTLSSTTLSFTTLAPLPPVVITTGSSSITLSSASMSGNVTDDGGLPVLERGFFISSVSTPSSSSTKVVVSSTGTGSFSANITGLQSGTTYYYRAYARNAAYLALSSTTLSFTTLAPLPPVVITTGSSSITLSSASMSGNVTDDGGLPVLERGFFISSVSTPSSSSTKVIASSTGTGSFSANITGLQSGTTYYYRAYARNAAYLALSSTTLSFATQRATLPTVTTTQQSNVMATTMITGGNVLDDGGERITSRGVIWSIKAGGNLNNANVVSSGSGLGSYATQLSGLPSNTIIYFRAFAQNAAGLVGYGVERTATTSMSIPTLSSPLNNATIGCCTWNFKWSTVNGASSYQIQLSKNVNFSNSTINILNCGSGSRPSNTYVNVHTSNIAEACVNAALSTGRGVWYWRVRAVSGSNFSDWSSVRSFNYQ